MMANATINLVGLDFNNIKSNLKDYLKRSDSPFKDFIYEGSNISALLDLLAYNTYLNNFYTNMVASEMFLDTANLRDSIISHAKELNYIPQSFKSAIARINFTITPSTNIGSIVIPKGATFTSKIGSNNYTFSIADNIVVNANNTDGKFYVTTNIYEGIYNTDTFVYSSNVDARFTLSNPTIDLSSLTISVIENSGANTVEYTQANSFLGLNPTSNVFFLQAATNDQYEIFFGDGVTGHKPAIGSTVVARYRTCNGELPNGASVFDIDGPIQGQANISSITTIFPAAGGAVSESLDSIKRNAPRHYQNQERAVTAADYENILIQKFPEIQAISAYGGEELDPPQYGKVFIAVDVVNADGTPEVTKQKFTQYLRPKTPLSIDPVVIDPDFLFCKVNTKVKYNVNQTSLKATDISTIVAASISKYNTQNLAGFKKTLKYSRMVNAIDAAHSSIISNDTTVIPYKEIIPNLNSDESVTVSFGFELSAVNNLPSVHKTEEVHTMISSPFIYRNTTCVLEDDGEGKVFISVVQGDQHTNIKRIGSIDYSKGIITIEQFNISGYDGTSLKFFVVPAEKDISSLQNTILTIRDNDINIEVTEVRE